MSDELENQQESEVFGVEEEFAPETFDRYRDANGKPRPELWRIGVDELNTINSAPALFWQDAGPNPLNNIATTDSRRYQGFAPVGGEVTDIAIDVSGAADAKMYAATNNGGIW